MARALTVYLCITAFTAFFGAVYELFSHEVYSYYMIYAFALPLVPGMMPLALMLAFDGRAPGRLSFNLYNSGIAALTVGCLIKGVLDIFGTTNDLIYFYLVLGVLFVVTGIAAYLLKK